MKKVYTFIICLLFATGAVVFCAFPRSTYSQIEKRDLAALPEFSFEKLFDGSYTRDISSWFSDTEPFREELMALSMYINEKKGMAVQGEENITFHAGNAPAEDDNRTIDDYENNITADENAKLADSGTIIVGSGPNVRALMIYGGSSNGGGCFAEMVNKYKRTFGSRVNVYCMAIPIATDFYLPDKAKGRSHSSLPTIRNIYAHLDPDVKAVNVYTTLANHVKENIFLRTDHHWAPLGAYYAARQFAEVAKVPFKPLADYEKRVVHRFVGSMYGYSKDRAVKNAPEDFVFYVPKNVQYTTTYINYDLNEQLRVVSESKPYQGQFFTKIKDGSGNAYLTFMGSDFKLTKVTTGTHNGRRLLIIKDSFGNALPGNMFYSFEEIHVVDFRYFTKNMTAYVNGNRITDILFAFNIFNCNASGACDRVVKYLTQRDGTYSAPTPSRPAQPASTNPADALLPTDDQMPDIAPAIDSRQPEQTDPTRPTPQQSALPQDPQEPAEPVITAE